MITDPWFYLAAIPAMLIFGISKGGFAGGFGILSVPLMALVIPPAQAAAIMLPLLCVMDIGAVWAYRNTWDRANMRILLPAGLVGVATGMLGFRYISSDGLKLLLGLISIGFLAYRWTRRGHPAPASHSVVKGSFWGWLGGVASFIAHAGGPPVNIYLLPQRLEPAQLVGTTVVLFTVLNVAKLGPYAALGLFSMENIYTSIVLAPAGLGGVALGLWLRKRVNEVLFYQLVYGCLALTGGKLLWDAMRALAG